MKNLILLITIFSLLLSISKAQNLFFIGEKNYQCSPTFTLIGGGSMNNIVHLNDLNVLIAKNGETGMLVLSRYVTDALIKGKVLVYLDDGTVITCIDRNIYDYVDNIATTVYYLTKEEIEKMKNSNINTIRYTIKYGSAWGGYRNKDDFSAKNIAHEEIISYGDLPHGPMWVEKTDVTEFIKELFK